MASYRVDIGRRAQKQLARIPLRYRERVIEATRGLAQDPRPFPQSSKLEGRGDEDRRLRVGDYRVLYRVDDSSRVVLVGEVWHRQRDYR